MSIPAFAWAFERGAALNLLAADRLVLIYLADKANGERVCWPGQETIVRFTGLALRTVRASLQRLEKAHLIRAEARGGCVTRYHIMRDTPANGNGVSQANSAAVTPANGNGVETGPRQMGPTHPGKSCAEPRQMVPPTPANGTPEPSSNQEENLDARERAQGKDQNSLEKGSEAQPPPESPPLKAPLLDATGGGVSTFRPPEPASDDPAIRRLIGGLARGFQNNHPPRAARRSPSEQIEELDGEALPPIRRGPVAPVRTVAEQLAILRGQAA